MFLEDEQMHLLAKFVEAHRNAPRGSRAAFLATEGDGDSEATFLHPTIPALNFHGSIADAEVLARCGLLSLSYGSGGSPLFYVLPEGIQFYEARKLASPPVQAVEEDIRGFLAGPEVSSVHSSACAKWEQAASLLWAADSAQQLTTIGHLCREALQEFAASVAKHHSVDVAAIGAGNTVARLKEVLRVRRDKLAATDAAFLDALVSYWGTVSDLVQRQEHGAQREGVPLVWEDARRVVFQTLVVMYEVVRSIG